MVKAKNRKHVLEYVKKHHRWIIGIFITSLISVIGLMIQIHSPPVTDQAYYLVGQDSPNPQSLQKINCKGSQATKRNDAARCSTDGSFSSASILDPCFLTFAGKVLDCPQKPTGPSKYFKFDQIEKTQPYEGKSQFPWYIYLNSGEGCKYFLGGASAFADGRIDYSCDNDIFLALPLDRSQPVWQIGCYNEQKNTFRECSIKSAWF